MKRQATRWGMPTALDLVLSTAALLALACLAWGIHTGAISWL